MRLRVLSKEPGYLLARVVWTFVGDEMPGGLDRREVASGKIVTQPVCPLDFEHLVARSPAHASGNVDGWKGWSSVTNQLEARRVLRDVPVEPPLQVSRGKEVFDPSRDILILEGIRTVGPVAQKVAEVGLARRAARPDELGRPRLLVERLIPDLLEMIWVAPPPADPGVGAIEKEQACESLGMGPGVALGNVSADVMAYETEALNSKHFDEAVEIVDVVVEPVSLGGGSDRLLGIAKPPEVGDYDIEIVAQGLDDLPPYSPELGPPVQEHEGEATPAPDEVDSYAVGLDVLGLSGFSQRFWPSVEPPRLSVVPLGSPPLGVCVAAPRVLAAPRLADVVEAESQERTSDEHREHANPGHASLGVAGKDDHGHYPPLLASGPRQSLRDKGDQPDLSCGGR